MWRTLLILLLSCTLTDEPSPLEPIGRLDRKLVPEASGIVKSRRHAGVFWVHNDSGNPPAIFAIHADGRIIREFRLEIPNIDWEDIAIDDQGHLYIGDIGNNLGALPIRAIYRIDEPDPAKPAVQPLKATAVSRYALPRGNRFDAESLEYDEAERTCDRQVSGRPRGRGLFDCLRPAGAVVQTRAAAVAGPVRRLY